MRTSKKKQCKRSRAARKRWSDTKARKYTKTSNVKKIRMKRRRSHKTKKKKTSAKKKSAPGQSIVGPRASRTETKGCAMAAVMFGPCDKRKRNMDLKELGIKSRTRAANGKKRTRSLHKRMLEYDYIKDNILTFMPALVMCLQFVGTSMPQYAWMTIAQLEELGVFFPISVALEIDGKQHVVPVKKFGGRVALFAQRENDRIKEANSCKNKIITKRVPNWDTENPKAWTCDPKEFERRVNEKLLGLWEHIIYRVYTNIQTLLSLHGNPNNTPRLNALITSFMDGITSHNLE